MALKLSLGEFICGRLADVGCYHVFGISGDYSLNIMNSMIAHPDVQLLKCFNELDLAYAAEGYARVNGFGAVIVVQGCGELGTLNALGLANGEKIPMILIVATMPTTNYKRGLCARHMTDPIDPYRSTRTTNSSVEAAVFVDSIDNIIDRIDNLLITSINRKRPVALHVPTDMAIEEVWIPVGREHLRHAPLAPTRGLPIRGPLDAKQQAEINFFATEALKLLRNAKTPVLVVGNQVVCFNLQSSIQRLAESLEAKVMHVPRLTGVIARDHPSFVPTGPLTNEQYDCVCQIGYDPCDMYLVMTQGRTADIQLSVLGVRIGRATVDTVFYPDVLATMQQLIDTESSNQENTVTEPKQAITKFEIKPPRVYTDDEMKAPITARALAEWAAEYGSPNEVRVCCSGLAVWGMLDFPSRLPRPEFTQEFYITIGWALPATIGVMFGYQSLKEKPTISCWIGDGAFLMTALALAPLQQYSTELGFVVNVFLLENKGYLIERVMWEGPYNDLPNLKYEGLALFAGCHYVRVDSLKDLEAITSTTENSKIGTTLYHVPLGKFDCVDKAGALAFGDAIAVNAKIRIDRPTRPSRSEL